MESIEVGGLVKVAGGGPELDGIVFDTPSSSKIIVAVVDPTRGPSFRTVSPKALTERAEEGPHDRALRLLVRRTPASIRGGSSGADAGARGRSGFQRGAMHRTTGK
jgi:hypothetical protein